jgi:chorismate synthase
MIYITQTVVPKLSLQGIQGGISNGMDIYFSASKPAATIMQNKNLLIIKEI